MWLGSNKTGMHKIAKAKMLITTLVCLKTNMLKCFVNLVFSNWPQHLAKRYCV